MSKIVYEFSVHSWHCGEDHKDCDQFPIEGINYILPATKYPEKTYRPLYCCEIVKNQLYFTLLGQVMLQEVQYSCPEHRPGFIKFLQARSDMHFADMVDKKEVDCYFSGKGFFSRRLRLLLGRGSSGSSQEIQNWHQGILTNLARINSDASMMLAEKLSAAEKELSLLFECEVKLQPVSRRILMK